jgi:hypothetical protein
MAPEAVEGAALEKDRRPDAGPVVKGEPLDVEDQAFRDGHISSTMAFHIKIRPLFMASSTTPRRNISHI